MPNTETTTAILPSVATVLSEAQTRLEDLEVSRIDSEHRYQIEILPVLLKQGLHCLKAHTAFCVNPGKGGRAKKPSTVDGSPPQGFEGWLSGAAPWLKKTSAYRYMTAVRGLGLQDSATEEDIDSALAARGLANLSLRLLCDAAADPVDPPGPPEPKKLEQQEFDFLRESLSAFRVESETLCRLKPRLDAYPDFKRAATARAYSILFELTGTHWSPSDDPDPLASVDPDAFTL